MLSLFDPEDVAMDIIPDYSLSTAKVYTALVMRYITHCRHLGILNLGGLQRNVPGLPSWVPDWTTPANNLNANIFSASGDLYVNVEHLGAGVLKVSGVVVSRIEQAARIPVNETTGVTSYIDSIRSHRPNSAAALDHYGGPIGCWMRIAELFALTTLKTICFSRPVQQPVLTKQGRHYRELLGRARTSLRKIPTSGLVPCYVSLDMRLLVPRKCRYA
jgi:hypothetical protein